MATQIHKPKVYGNFKKSRTATEPAKPHSNSERYKDRPGMSEEHCALVRKMPCTCCLRIPAGEIHHLKSIGNRGMGIRSEDRYGVPMCRAHHEEVEAAGTKNEFKFFQNVGIDNVHLLADDLWGSTGSLPKMIKILMAHRGHK